MELVIIAIVVALVWGIGSILRKIRGDQEKRGSG
jgi:hypothetical protein